MTEQGNFDYLNEREPVMDHCGIVAAYCEGGVEFMLAGVAGLHKIQTRGYDGAGVICFEGRKVKEYKNKGMVGAVFNEQVMAEFAQIKAPIWLFQTRYGTVGNGEMENIQPIIRQTADGEMFAVIHNGQFIDNRQTGGESDTVLFAQELAALKGLGWDERILLMQEAKVGAWSMAIATPVGLYVMRDKLGIRPLCLGRHQLGDGRNIWVVASETAAMEAMGISEIVEVEPGAVLKINEEGVCWKVPGEKLLEKAVCIFENVYLSNGGSVIHRPRESIVLSIEPTVSDFRRECGKLLAAEEPPGLANRVDLAIGIPGTGIAGGRSFALALGIPYIQAIADKRPAEHDARTFMTPVITEIPDKIRGHFYFDRNFLVGMRVVLIDDSIVRGNITRGLIKILKEEYKVKEVHIRVLCPPIDKPCHLGVNTRDSGELIAATQLGQTEKIAVEIGAGSLRYLSDKSLIAAAGGGEGFCLGCMMGHLPPVNIHGQTNI